MKRLVARLLGMVGKTESEENRKSEEQRDRETVCRKDMETVDDFDFYRAEAGEPVKTFGGLTCRLIEFHRKSKFPLVGLIRCNGEDILACYDRLGRVEGKEGHISNLRMA